MTHNPMQFDVTKLPERELGQMQRRAAKPKPIPSPESPRQANSGARVQPVRCHCASALKWDALRRFCGDGFLDSELKTLVQQTIHAKMCDWLGHGTDHL